MRFHIYYGDDMPLSNKDRHDFDRGRYTCERLLRDRKGRPMVISKCKDDNGFPRWKVEYGCSCVVFQTMDEALAFCKGRFEVV